jgi:HEAT repeat protein
MSAVLMLGECDETAVTALIVALRDEDPNVRITAAGSLGRVKDPSAVTALVEVLDDSHVNVRRTAAWALGEIRSRAAVTPLIRALSDKDWALRAPAAEALGRIGDTRAVGSLIVALKSRDESIRVSAATALGRLRDKSATGPLLIALQAESEELRKEAATALGLIKDPQAVGILMVALSDPIVCYAARQALARIGEPAVDGLIATLKNTERAALAREAAALTLGDIKTPRAAEALSAVLTNRKERLQLRTFVAEALGSIGKNAATAIPALRKTANDETEDKHVRKAAAEALKKVDVSNPGRGPVVEVTGTSIRGGAREKALLSMRTG